MKQAYLVFGSNSVIVRDFINQKILENAKIIGISKTNNKYIKKNKNFIFIKRDVSKADNLKLISVLEKKYKITSIIYAIGGTLGKKKILEDKKEWIKVWDNNFGYTININNFFYKKFQSRKYGRILYFSSTAVDNKIGPSIYSSVKRSIEDYVQKMGNNFANKNIYTNAIMPGIVSGKGNNWGKFEKQKKPNHIKKVIKSMVSTEKFGRSENFTDLINLLVSEKNHYITGSVIRADGGYKL
jgi:NAD(P)-dependent dehydrogenase (short-subunit alcohol dehydrogenase family)